MFTVVLATTCSSTPIVRWGKKNETVLPSLKMVVLISMKLLETFSNPWRNPGERLFLLSSIFSSGGRLFTTTSSTAQSAESVLTAFTTGIAHDSTLLLGKTPAFKLRGHRKAWGCVCSRWHCPCNLKVPKLHACNLWLLGITMQRFIPQDTKSCRSRCQRSNKGSQTPHSLFLCHMMFTVCVHGWEKLLNRILFTVRFD